MPGRPIQRRTGSSQPARRICDERLANLLSASGVLYLGIPACCDGQRPESHPLQRARLVAIYDVGG